MVKSVGLTDAVLAAMSDGGWHTCAAVTGAVPEQFRKAANVILCQLFKAGRIQRRGEHRAYEYRALPDAARRRSRSRPHRASTSTTAAGEKAAAPQRPNAGPVRPARNAPASRPAAVSNIAPVCGRSFAASLGTAVGELVTDRPLPANPAQGRIEDALAAVLDKREARKLDEILDAVPNGWSRTDVISGLTEGVIDGWIRARRAGARDAYLLVRNPPVHRTDPLVARFKTLKLRERCLALDTDLADALVDARACDAPAELVHALVDLRRAAARTVQQMER